MNRDTPEFAEFLTTPLTREHRSRTEVVLYYHFGLEHQADIAALLDLIIDQDFSAIRRLTRANAGSVYLPALLKLARAAPLQDGWAELGDTWRLHAIDETQDFLAGHRDDRIWGLVRSLNFLYRTKIRPRHRIAIVAAIRNEGINLLEWLAHHRALGVEDFFLYANDNDDGSTKLLDLLAEQGLINVIANRTRLITPGNPNMFRLQAKCFLHAAHILPETLDYEWLLFLDPDEFLVTKPVMETPDMPCPLDDLFARLAPMTPAPAAVAFNWKFFTAPLTLHRAPGLNFERFTQRGQDEHVKTLVRGRHCVSFHTSHIPRLIPGDTVLNGSLEPADSPYFRMPPAQAYGQVNHYYNKSFEEFIAKHARVWDALDLGAFFTMAGNRNNRPVEHTPPAWIARVRAEISRLQNLPGIAAALENIEAHFQSTITAYDNQHGLRTMFDRLASSH
jgi:hypothetical protein